MTISLEHVDMVMNTVFNQSFRNNRVKAGQTVEIDLPDTYRRTWFDISYAEGTIDGDDSLGDFDYTLTGLTVGHDLVATQNQTLGVYFSYGTQKMDEHDKAIQDFDGDSYHLGLYLNHSNVSEWNISGIVAYGYGDHSSKRSVFLANSHASTSADYNSHSFYTGAKATAVGYQNNLLTLSPELGLHYIYYRQNSFKESGDPNLSLKLDSSDAQAIVASVGLNARFSDFTKKASVYPLAFIRYEHDFYANKNNEHKVDAALVAHPDYSQKFVGQNRGEHSILTGLGLGSDLSSALQIQGGFVYAKHSHGSEWGAGLNVHYSW